MMYFLPTLGLMLQPRGVYIFVWSMFLNFLSPWKRKQLQCLPNNAHIWRGGRPTGRYTCTIVSSSGVSKMSGKGVLQSSLAATKMQFVKTSLTYVEGRINFVTDTILNTESIQQLKWYGVPCHIYNGEPNQNQKLIRTTVSNLLKSVICNNCHKNHP